MRILIPNGTSVKNIGDQAMLESLVKLVNKPDREIVLHTYDPELQPIPVFKKTTDTLYSWTAFENTNFFVRVIRLVEYLWVLFCIKVGLIRFIFGKYRELVNDYLYADALIFAAGGYLRTQKGIFQSINLIMLLSLFWVASKMRGFKAVAPISLGPFAYKWQKVISWKCLGSFDVVMAREKFSYEALLEGGLKNIELATDIALLHDPLPRAENEIPVIGFTIRKWLPPLEQERLEQSYIDAFKSFTDKYNVKIRPIVQVDAQEYGDIDSKITDRIAAELSGKGVDVLPKRVVKDLQSAFEIYSELDLLVGMRMHSNIIAATQLIPFLAISYEYKTRGISESLGFSDYVIDVEKVNSENLEQKLEKLYVNRKAMSLLLVSKLNEVQREVADSWELRVVKFLN